jgi:hypothetical protein
VVISEDQDTVLGFGINYTMNPKTGRLDYLDVSSELMSSDAFYLHKVRRGPKGEEIRAFLPLYLTAEHWQRGKVAPLLKRVQKELCPESDLEEGLLRLLCVALNTRSVLLADKGVVQCDASFGVFSQLQRLLMALCSELPLMQRLVEDRVHSFMVSERNREKDSVPSLGEFVPLMLVCKRYSWKQVRPHLVREVLSRNVLWAGRHNVALANNENPSFPAAERLSGFWTATAVSNRLMMLSAMFVALARRESLAEQARVLDRLYGNLPSKTLAIMKRATASILSPNASWPLYFKVLVGAPLPEHKVEKLLKDAVRDSRAKVRVVFFFFFSCNDRFCSKQKQKGIPLEKHKFLGCALERNFQDSARGGVVHDGQGCERGDAVAGLALSSWSSVLGRVAVVLQRVGLVHSAIAH